MVASLLHAKRFLLVVAFSHAVCGGLFAQTQSLSTPASLRAKADSEFETVRRDFYFAMADLAEASPEALDWQDIFDTDPLLSNQTVPLSLAVGKEYQPHIFPISARYNFRAFTFKNAAVLLGTTPDAARILERHLEQLTTRANEPAERTALRQQLKGMAPLRWTVVIRQFPRDGAEGRMHLQAAENGLELIWGEGFRLTLSVEQLEGYVGNDDAAKAFLPALRTQLAKQHPGAKVMGAIIAGETLVLYGAVEKADDRKVVEHTAMEIVRASSDQTSVKSASAREMVASSESQDKQLSFLMFPGRDDRCQVERVRLENGRLILTGSYVAAGDLHALQKHIDARLAHQSVRLALEAVGSAVKVVDTQEMKVVDLKDRIHSLILEVTGIQAEIYGASLDSDVLVVRGRVEDEQARNNVAEKSVPLLSKLKEDEYVGKTYEQARAVKMLLLRSDVSADIRALEVAELFLSRQLNQIGAHVQISKITGDAKSIRIAGFASSEEVRQKLRQAADDLYTMAVRAKLVARPPEIDISAVLILGGAERIAVQSAQSLVGVRINSAELINGRLELHGTLQARDSREEMAVRNSLREQLLTDFTAAVKAGTVQKIPDQIDVSWLVNDQLTLEDQVAAIVRRGMQDSTEHKNDTLEGVGIRHGGPIFIVELYGRVASEQNRASLKEVAERSIQRLLDKKVLGLNLRLDSVDVRDVSVGVPESVCVVIDWSSFMERRYEWLASTLCETPGFAKQGSAAFRVFVASPDAVVPWSWDDIKGRVKPAAKSHEGGTLGAFGKSLAVFASDSAPIRCRGLHFVTLLLDVSKLPRPKTIGEIDSALGGETTAESVKAVITDRFPIRVWYDSSAAYETLENLVGPRLVNRYNYQPGVTSSFLRIDADASE